MRRLPAPLFAILIGLALAGCALAGARGVLGGSAVVLVAIAVWALSQPRGDRRAVAPDPSTPDASKPGAGSVPPSFAQDPPLNTLVGDEPQLGPCLKLAPCLEPVPPPADAAVPLKPRVDEVPLRPCLSLAPCLKPLPPPRVDAGAPEPQHMQVCLSVAMPMEPPPELKPDAALRPCLSRLPPKPRVGPCLSPPRDPLQRARPDLCLSVEAPADGCLAQLRPNPLAPAEADRAALVARHAPGLPPDVLARLKASDEDA
jgi:hypothetical protein